MLEISKVTPARFPRRSQPEFLTTSLPPRSASNAGFGILSRNPESDTEGEIALSARDYPPASTGLGRARDTAARAHWLRRPFRCARRGGSPTHARRPCPISTAAAPAYTSQLRTAGRDVAGLSVVRRDLGRPGERGGPGRDRVVKLTGQPTENGKAFALSRPRAEASQGRTHRESPWPG